MTETRLQNIASLLAGPPVWKRETWPKLVVVWTATEHRVVRRQEHAAWLASKGATLAAIECQRRKAPAGHVLAWSTATDSSEPKRGRFFLVNLDAAIQARAEGDSNG